MHPSQAAALIRCSALDGSLPQSWCDLGCGRGTFTLALAASLPSGSTVHAVDLDEHTLQTLPAEQDGVVIRKMLADFTRVADLRLPALDGVLMANSLHFVKEQHLLLEKLRLLTGRFLIVEYETAKASRWGPYPVSFERLRMLMGAAGVGRVERLANLRSRFGGLLYAALAENR